MRRPQAPGLEEVFRRLRFTPAEKARLLALTTARADGPVPRPRRRRPAPSGPRAPGDERQMSFYQEPA
jgi:hypothetical protein